MVSSFDKKEDVYQLFMQAPVGVYLLKGENYIIEMANEPILKLWGKGKGVIGKPVLESFPEVKEQGFIDLLDKVRTTGQPFQTDEIAVWYNYDGQKVQKYVTLLYQPFHENDEITGIFSIATDVTENVLAKRQLEESEKNLRNLVLQAPVAMCIFRGPDYIVEIANERMVEFWGKQSADVVGKPIFEGLPEVKDQGFEQLLNQVFKDGITIKSAEHPVQLPRGGSMETTYVNFVYEPLREQAGKITGVMAVAIEVTDQVLSRKKAEESAQEVRSVVESAPFPIGVYIGKEMRIRLANQSIIDVWKKGADVIGKTYAQVLPELKESGIYEQLDQVYTTGVPYHAKNQRVDLMVGDKLKPFYFNYSFTPLFDKNGDVYGVMNTAAEVTDLATAMQKIKEAEEKAILAIETAELGTYEYNFQTGEMTVSQRFNEFFGLQQSTDLNTYVSLFHPEDQDVRKKAHEEAHRTGFLSYEARRTLNNNDYRWLRFKGRILYDENGQSQRLLGVAQDITEQKLFAEQLSKQVKERTQELEEAQDTLLDSYHYLQTVINKFDSAFAALTPVFDGEEIVDFRFKLTNEAYATYTKVAPEAVQNKLVGDVFPGYKQTDAFEKYIQTYKTGQPNKWDLHYNADGLDVYFTVLCSKVENEVVVHLTDFTTLKSLQYELMRNIEELKHTNSNLENFAYASSHDLKEPIRKIHFFSDALKQELKGKLTEKQERYFEKLQNASNRMSSLIDDLLAYSQVTKGEGEQETVDINKKVQLVLEDLELEVQQKHAKIIIEDLPTLKGNKRQLQQLFQNLIGNALKYTKADQQPEIKIAHQLVDGDDVKQTIAGIELRKKYHLFEVQDNGIGFAEKDAERIFNVFTRLHSNAVFQGSGVGLSIAQKVVHNHKGFIWAEGEPNVGATFKVLLPAE